MNSAGFASTAAGARGAAQKAGAASINTTATTGARNFIVGEFEEGATLQRSSVEGVLFLPIKARLMPLGRKNQD